MTQMVDDGVDRDTWSTPRTAAPLAVFLSVAATLGMLVWLAAALTVAATADADSAVVELLIGLVGLGMLIGLVAVSGWCTHRISRGQRQIHAELVQLSQRVGGYDQAVVDLLGHDDRRVRYLPRQMH